MAQLNVKGMVTDVFHSIPGEGSKAKEESTYVTCADGDNGGVLKFKFPGKVEFKPGQFIEGMATVKGQMYGNSLTLGVVSHTFKAQAQK
jgi:hypothetical protein